MSPTSDTGRFATPGDEIGTEEEYEAGAGTLNEEGRIRAALAGPVGEQERTLRVRGQPALTPFAKGTWVVGRIDNIAEPVALAVVEADEESNAQMGAQNPQGPGAQGGRPNTPFNLEQARTPDAGGAPGNPSGANQAKAPSESESSGAHLVRHPKSSAYVVLHASYIKRGYVKKVKDEYRIGDIIRARVVELKNGEYHISTDDPHAGCLIAFCAGCRQPMQKRPAGLQCPACDRRDNRKLADDYRVMPDIE